MKQASEQRHRTVRLRIDRSSDIDVKVVGSILSIRGNILDIGHSKIKSPCFNPSFGTKIDRRLEGRKFPSLNHWRLIDEFQYSGECLFVSVGGYDEFGAAIFLGKMEQWPEIGVQESQLIARIFDGFGNALLLFRRFLGGFLEFPTKKSRYSRRGVIGTMSRSRRLLPQGALVEPPGIPRASRPELTQLFIPPIWLKPVSCFQ